MFASAFGLVAKLTARAPMLSGATFMILAWRGAENELRAKQMRKKLLENNGAANLAITTQP